MLGLESRVLDAFSLINNFDVLINEKKTVDPTKLSTGVIVCTIGMENIHSPLLPVPFITVPHNLKSLYLPQSKSGLETIEALVVRKTFDILGLPRPEKNKHAIFSLQIGRSPYSVFGYYFKIEIDPKFRLSSHKYEEEFLICLITKNTEKEFKNSKTLKENVLTQLHYLRDLYQKGVPFYANDELQKHARDEFMEIIQSSIEELRSMLV